MSNTVEEGSRELGRYLCDYQVRSGLSSKALAAQIGIDPATLDALMTGRTKLRQSTRGKLTTFFGEEIPLPLAAPNYPEYTCERCGRQFRDKPSTQRRYCSLTCDAADRRKRLSPAKTPFARFLDTQWRDSKLTISEWGRSLKLDRHTVQRLTRGGLPRQSTLDQLRRVFGDDLPDTPTATERRIATLQANAGDIHTPEVKRKAAEARRGLKQSAEHTAKALATRRANGSYERWIHASTEHSRSKPGRCLSALFGRLNGNPNPSWSQVKEWAEETGKKVGEPTKVVLAWWEPYLKKRGLWNAAGRKPDPVVQRRCRLVTSLYANAPKTENGDLNRGQWEEIEKQVTEITGEPWTRAGLGRWYRDHKRKGCVCNLAHDDAS